MNRREYLAAGTVLTGALAGCASVSRERPLQGEKTIDESRRGSATLRFTDDNEDEDLFRVHVQKRYGSEERRIYYPFRVSTWQPDGYRLTSLGLQFRSPPYPTGFSPAGIALQEDGHADKAILSRKNDDPSTTVLDFPDVSAIGRGSVVVNILLTADEGQDPQELWSRMEATLSAEGVFGRQYSARGETTLEVP